MITATPADRSNSPPIISSATPTAMIPMVELSYSTVENAATERNGSATAKKNTKIANAATNAPTSGRWIRIVSNDLRSTDSSAAGGGGAVSTV